MRVRLQRVLQHDSLVATQGQLEQCQKLLTLTRYPSVISHSPIFTSLHLRLNLYLFKFSHLVTADDLLKRQFQQVVAQEESRIEDFKAQKTHKKKIMIFFIFASSNVFAITLCKQRIN